MNNTISYMDKRVINTGSVTGNNTISYMDKRVIKKDVWSPIT